jgi:hypothetical protein
VAPNVRITVGGVKLEAELSGTETARAVLGALPIETGFNTWGDEFYFEIPPGNIKMPLDETATLQVKKGDIGYWPPGRALAIFFGPTPMSDSDEPVPASEVNLVGRVLGDATLLRAVKTAKTIRLERI